METSTPLVHRKDLRRQSLMRTPIVSSPLRRSIISNQLPEHDDEQERSNRRSMVAMQRRVSNIATSTESPLVEINQITNEFQIKDHLRICTKLYTENKISIKNAWELHIIDIIRKITSSDSGNVLQVAGSSLDIGAKVYAIRVDDVHTKGLKLASTMSTAPEHDASQNDGNADETGVEPVRRKKNANKRKRKMMLGNKQNTIDKDGKSLFAPLKEMESVLFSTKENIEVSATDNLFTYKLHVNPATNEFELMSQEKYHVTKPDCTLQLLEENEIEFPDFKDFTLYQPFKDFDILLWDPDEEEKQLQNGSLPDVALDENGIPIPELDGSIHDIFQDDDAPVSDVEEHQEEFQAQIHGEVVHIVDAIPEENRIETDYGYNSIIRTTSGKFIDKIWAGPCHWKVKFNRRSSARYSGSTVQQVAKCTRRPKVQQEVNFNIIPENVRQTMKKHVMKRTPATVALEKITLPLPQISSAEFHKLTDEFLSKPGVPRPKRVYASNEANDYEVPVYNYENPNDSLYCSQHTDDRDDAEPMNNSFEEEAPPAAQENFLAENLVNAPEMVTASQVPYAMQAKKMDMKKLKAAVWKRLTTNCGDKEVDSNTLLTQPVKFSEIYNDLPNHLNKDMRKELSCPLAFVALLHLCNEKNLQLDQNANNLKDFTVMKAVENS